MNHALTVLKTRPVTHVKLGGRGQVTIPPAIVRRLRLKRGEEFIVGVFEHDRAIVLAPRRATRGEQSLPRASSRGRTIRGEQSRTIPKDQEWYYTPRWQKMMQEAFDDVKAGRMLGPFDTAEEAIRELKSAKV